MTDGTQQQRIRDIHIVSDRTRELAPDEGYLRLRRLELENEDASGMHSERYHCDLVTRLQPDAVAVVVYARDDDGGIRVALRSGIRPPIYLRSKQPDRYVTDDTFDHLLIEEIAAGLLEDKDKAGDPIRTGGAREVAEELGYVIDPARLEVLGGPLFPSPGISDEKVYFCAAEVDLAERDEPEGDGSVMEQAGQVMFRTIEEALARCRSGEEPDMKTEIGLLRLASHLGYALRS